MALVPRITLLPAAPAHRITPLTQSFINRGFVNVCILRNKVAEVTDILQQYNFEIFGVAETWLDSTTSDSDIDIPGYCVIWHDRPVHRGGGVCFYLRSGLQIKPRPELSDSNIESSWIEVKGRRRQKLVGCLYRPPDESISYWQTRTDPEGHCDWPCMGFQVVNGGISLFIDD